MFGEMGHVQYELIEEVGLDKSDAEKFQSTFQDAIAFITGGASGLGFAQARLLGALGLRVVIADVQQESLGSASEYLQAQNVDVLPIQLDVRDRVAYAAARENVYEYFGDHPRLLLNTAGVNGFGPLHKASFGDFDWILGVNLYGVVNGIQTFLPTMLDRTEASWIATTGSMAGFMGNASAGIYAATKAAVFNLMESYHKTLPDLGVGVSIICPASIRSKIADTLDMRPPELAETSSFNDDSEFKQLQRQLYATGMDPLRLAGYVVEGIVNRRLYILPFPETRGGLQNYFDEIISAFDHYGCPDEEAQQRADDFVKYQRAAAKLQ